ncbi:hypothetical protein FXO37_00612 [Capsicum annuum]|nr:hypothetical protein FXO37_00612 [Capsicum annuum]
MAVNGLMVMVAVGFNAVARMLNLNVNFMKGRDHVNNSMHSNASDAWDNLRFLGVIDLELLKEADSKDVGADNNLIGQFGVRFHLAFLISERRDDKRFAHLERTENLVKNYSQFVSFPIYTWQEKGYTKKVEVDDGLPCGSFWA